MAIGPTYERTVRGVPLWLLQEYLEALGARPGAAGGLVGAGWSARLAQLRDYQVGSLRVGQVRVQLWGNPETIAPIRAALDRRLIRGGG